MNKQRFKIVLLLLALSSCSKEETVTISTPVPSPVVQSLPVEQPVAVAAPAAAPAPAPVKKVEGLAVLIKLKNRADMRPHDESVWQAAVTGTGFLKHDALQTHDAATANVRYESGSNLDLRENTLVIFDKDPGLAVGSPDRVLLKSGRLTGATKKELWVFTNAGLVQIKSVKKNQLAQATLSVDSAKKLIVAVKTGTADVVLKKNATEFQKFNLAENTEHDFKAKAEFDVSSDAATVPVVKSATLAELVIESPADNAISSTEQLEIKGKLTDMGAKLLINGQLAEVADDLTFKKSITLTEGTNLIVFQLVRSDASVKFYRKNIRYDKSR